MEKNYLYTVNRIVYTMIMTVFASLVFIVSYKPLSGVYYENATNGIYRFIYELDTSINNFEISSLILVVLIFYFFYHAYFNNKNNFKKYLFSFVISFAFAILTLIGKSFQNNNSLSLIYGSNCQIIKSILIGLGYMFLYGSICLSFLNIDFKRIKKKEKKKDNEQKIKVFIKKHHSFLIVLFLVIMWMPIVIIYYPGTATGDTVDSLAQFFNVRDLCWSAKAIKLVNENVIINKHHSVFFTVVFGIIVKMGKFISSYDLGMFLFIVLQIGILIGIFTYVMHYLIKCGVPYWIIISSVIFLGISPIVSSYAITAIKDTLGAIFVFLYNVFLLKLIRDYDKTIKSRGTIIFFMISILMVLLIKSNALNIILVSYMGLLFYFRDDKIRRKRLLFILLVPMVIYMSYDKILLVDLGVTGTNKKESYSIPFMQIARVANRGVNNISDEDIKIIDKVLNYRFIRLKYNPDLSDNVKNTYKKDVTDKELDDFWKIYFKYLKKYPKTYIASFVNSTYSYFFPETGETDGVRKLDYRIGKKSIFNLNLNDKFKTNRLIYEEILNIFKKIPILSLLNHLAFYTWFLIFSIIYIIKCRNYKYLVPLLSLGFILGSCLISPVNGSFRYILSIVFSMPLIVSINYFVYKENNIKYIK